jgi:hypothetical protein
MNRDEIERYYDHLNNCRSGGIAGPIRTAMMAGKIRKASGISILIGTVRLCLRAEHVI